MPEYKKLLKKYISYIEHNDSEELIDNSYLLSSSCGEIKAFIKHNKHDLSNIFALCRRFARQNCVLDENAVTEYFINRALTENELEALPFMLRLALLELIYYQKDTAYACASLRRCESLDFSHICESLSIAGAVLSGDPSGIYPDMDAQSRSAYRTEIARIAKKHKISEESAARRVIELCGKEKSERKRHVGYYIFNLPLGIKKRNLLPFFYALCVFILPLSAFLYWNKGAVMSFALWFILSDIIMQLAQRLVLRFAPKRIFPSMDAEKPVPDDAKTVCAITAILTDENDVREYCEKLEQYYLTSAKDKNLCFVLLGDLPSAQSESCRGDSEILRCAENEIKRLNSVYGEHFILLSRERTYSKSEGAYIPSERKRGAVEALMSLCESMESELFIISGTLPEDLRYCVVLDGDTVPMPGAINRLIAAMRHPLNKPVFDRLRGIVTQGHAILQPRLSYSLQSSAFSSVFAGNGGSDIYGASSSELYESICNRSSFCGKGIIDIHAYNHVLCKRFPNGRILSHDLLEGCYLNAGFCPQAEFIDGFPKNISSYLRREHRWIRGDWQLLPWLFRSVPTLDGHERNPLRFYDKWRIIDNLRRSILSVFLLITLLSGRFLPFTAALSCVFLPFLLSRKSRRIHCAGHVLSEEKGTFLRGLMRFLLLPTFAWNGFSAALTALVRQFITHKKLLEWTTSSQAEKHRLGYLSVVLPQSIAAVFALLPRLRLPLYIKIMFTVFWLAAIPAIIYLCKKDDRAQELSSSESEWLKAKAGEMLAYFRENMNEENSFLPPDNIQLKPYSGIARRTSPTNIGFALVSLLAGADLGLYAFTLVFPLLERTISTLESMKKWHGQLYNWYDTKTALPLTPKTVSSVDSGNLLACLLVFKAGLIEYGAKELADRVDAIINAMDIAALYDSKRHLFYIGYNAENGEFFDGHYDMLESEARLCSYIMVSSGKAPVRHWYALNRRMGEKEGHRGLLSWSGTMFEYLMPSLFIPDYKGSLLGESAYYALHCQKSRASYPFGISESCYFAFDEELNYRYKAHGVKSAAMNRSMDNELVLSPYSAYLALSLDAHEAVKSLRAYDNMDMLGKYGFYEAVDFTASRIPSEREYMPVRCFMAHHLGMSICAAANALCGGIMQKRFMSYPQNRAFRYLLMEKMPTEAKIIPVPALPDKRTAPYNGGSEFYRADDYNAAMPQLTVMSNGSFRVMSTDTGIMRIMSGMRDISRFDGKNSGINFFFTDGSSLFGLTPAPLYNESEYGASFDFSSAVLRMKNDKFSSSVASFPAPDDTSCLFSVTIQNRSDIPLNGELIFCLEPVLDRQENFQAHPAFSKLFLSSESDGEGVMLSRRQRGDSREWYSYVSCSFPCRTQISREHAFGRSGFYGLIKYRESPASAPDPICVMRAGVSLQGGKSAVFFFAVSCGASREIAKQASLSALTLTKGSSSPRLRRISELLSFSCEDVKSAFSLYSRAVFISSPRTGLTVPSQVHGQELLWKFGISGDLPLIYARFDESKNLEYTLRRHLFLHLSGAYCDLLIITNDGGSYERKEYHTVLNILRGIDGESLVGIKGGVHIIDTASLAHGELESLMFLCGTDDGDIASHEKIHPLPLPIPDENKALSPEWGGNSISFDGNTPRIWSHPLANESFGWLACDRGCGNMWYLNSRENRINPWYNDPVAVNGPESLYLDGENLFAGKTAFVPGVAVYQSDKGVKVTAFVAENVPARIIIIDSDSINPGAHLIWHTSLQLGESFRERRFVVTHADTGRGIIYAENPANPRYAPYYFAVGSTPSPVGYTCDELDFMQGKFSMHSGAGYEPCIALEIPFEKSENGYRAVLVCGCFESFTQLDTVSELLRNAEIELKKAANHAEKLFCDLEIKTPDMRFDRFINGFALNQIINGRMLARSSIYQSSGAYGFRDQLQDAVSLLSAPPSAERYALVCSQILRAASRQFEEGDVQHWWHEDKYSVRGVRTRVSDDLLFLPYAVLEYVRISGDSEILSEQLPYLHDEPLREGENERLSSPEHTLYSESLWEHCRRAMALVIKRGTGAHGLALLGGGDWNDAMNEAGIKGRGESVWLSWFASMVARMMYEHDGSAEYGEFAEKLQNSAYNAWDGGWFLRGWHDDGSAIGSKSCPACRIDAISQAFSTIANRNDNRIRAARRRTALKNAYRFLPKDGVVRLFDPPFDEKHLNMGYIAAYPPGIRENGGQYTHGAVWLGMAMLKEGMVNEGAELLSMLLPSERGEEYKAEPFYLASDVYSGKNIHGMAGWTIYTGAAGWFYNAAVRDMLGLEFYSDRLVITPHIPDKWEGYSAILHQGSAQLTINIRRTGLKRLILDGVECEYIPLPVSYGCHECTCEI